MFFHFLKSFTKKETFIIWNGYLCTVKKQRIMKRNVLLILLFLLFFSCCKKNNELESEPNFSDIIVGTWVNIQIDGQQVLTNESFVMQLKPSKVQMFSQGVTIQENDHQWMESDQYTYSIKNKNIIIDGKNALDQSTHLEMEVVSVDQQMMTYKVKQLVVNQIIIPDNHLYTMQRVDKSLNSDLIGIWYGRDETSGSADTSYKYWEFLSNGNYNYYYFDEDIQLWICKEDNNGHYFLYGNLLAANFTNNLPTQEACFMYECWNIQIDGNSMDWSGLRENGATTLFSMEKVDTPPPTDYSKRILGTWVNTKIDNQLVLTDNAFIFNFDEMMVDMIAKGYVLDENNRLWQESSNFIYAVSQNVITIYGVDAVGQTCRMELRISDIHNDLMTYSVQKLELNGEEIFDDKIYTLQRSQKDCQFDIVGIWKGGETTEGKAQEHDYYWEFLSNGEYLFYYFDESVGHYVLKEDNNGVYYVYGDFLVMNMNDPIDGSIEGSNYEGWNIQIDGNSMIWECLRVQGTMEYSMEKVPSPPITR